MSKRDWGSIKSILHFDYPYENEPNNGLGDEASSETWTIVGNARMDTDNKKFGYRCVYYPDSDSGVMCENASGIFNISPSGSYELEALLKKTGTEGKIFRIGEHIDGVTSYDGHYYKVSSETATWEEAEAACEGIGGHLATSTSAGRRRRYSTTGGGSGCRCG